jgi:hypothetical protein
MEYGPYCLTTLVAHEIHDKENGAILRPSFKTMQAQQLSGPPGREIPAGVQGWPFQFDRPRGLAKMFLQVTADSIASRAGQCQIYHAAA